MILHDFAVPHKYCLLPTRLPNTLRGALEFDWQLGLEWYLGYILVGGWGDQHFINAVHNALAQAGSTQCTMRLHRRGRGPRSPFGEGSGNGAPMPLPRTFNFLESTGEEGTEWGRRQKVAERRERRLGRRPS